MSRAPAAWSSIVATRTSFGRTVSTVSSLITASYHWNWWMTSDLILPLFRYLFPHSWSLVLYASHPDYEPLVPLQYKANTQFLFFHTPPVEQSLVVL
jgi:hypothetical protein